MNRSRTCLPRARGFTAHDADAGRRDIVSSPCAGGHRMKTIPGKRWEYFPVRGGSPDGKIVKLKNDMYFRCGREFTVHPLGRSRRSLASSPCAGFTTRMADPGSCYRASSPHAGVHRAIAAATDCRQCVFPVRGGSPVCNSTGGTDVARLPRARGFTGREDDRVRRGQVSSLFAGFTGGQAGPLPLAHVSSPHAGGSPMIPLRAGRRPGVFPVRGGSPVDNTCLLKAPVCLPRARGFIDDDRWRVLAQVVSPPHTGVHRIAGTRSCSITSVFPARGGSRSLGHLQSAALQCLPRARGFTAGDVNNTAGPAVSSLCAGVHRIKWLR
jgi:hypothetical protein